METSWVNLPSHPHKAGVPTLIFSDTTVCSMGWGLDWSLLMPRMVLRTYLLIQWGQPPRSTEVKQPIQGHTTWEYGRNTGLNPVAFISKAMDSASLSTQYIPRVALR